MAEWTRKKIVTERTEYHVPTRTLGAPWAEVRKALNAAIAELVELGLHSEGAVPSDDLLRVLPGDESIIVYFERDTLP